MADIDPALVTLAGYMPAVPTPFDAAGALDLPAFERFCALQIEAGATALVVCGTTGEAPTLAPEEYGRLISAAVALSGGRVPLIAGAGSNATERAIQLTSLARTCKADAVLSVVPYYNKPSQAGLLAHFTEISERGGLPVILYDVPSRTVTGLSDETVIRLAALPAVIGLKDATGDIARVLRLRQALGGGFRLLSGDDATALAFLASGGDGCISVTSNMLPGLCRDMAGAIKRGHREDALLVAHPVAAITRLLFDGSSPVPLKFLLEKCGLMAARVRLPLVELDEVAQARLLAALAEVLTAHPAMARGVVMGLMRRC